MALQLRLNGAWHRALSICAASCNHRCAVQQSSQPVLFVQVSFYDMHSVTFDRMFGRNSDPRPLMGIGHFDKLQTSSWLPSVQWRCCRLLVHLHGLRHFTRSHNSEHIRSCVVGGSAVKLHCSSCRPHPVCRSVYRALADVVPPPYDTLRDLRLMDCELTAAAVASLAVVAGRLRVLHLFW